MVLTPNDKLLDYSIRHAVFLERFKSGQQISILRSLRSEPYEELIDRLRSRLDRLRRSRQSSIVGNKRYVALMDDVRSIVREGMTDVNRTLNSAMRGLISTEIEQQGRAFRRMLGANTDIRFPSRADLRGVLGTTYEGFTSRQWLTRDGRRLIDGTERMVRLGLALGESSDQIVNRIRRSGRVLRTHQNGVRANVRSSLANAAVQAREHFYAANRHFIRGVQYIAVLDHRTTEICASLHGNIYGFFEGPRPPIHMQCRSTTNAVLIGQPNPTLVTYREWFDAQPKSLQNRAFGPGRAQLLRDRKVSLDDLVSSDYKRLTLEQLRRSAA